MELQAIIYNNKQSLEKVQLEFEIRIQFYVMCWNLCGDYTIIIHLSFLTFVPSELMNVKYKKFNINEL